MPSFDSEIQNKVVLSSPQLLDWTKQPLYLYLHLHLCLYRIPRGVQLYLASDVILFPSWIPVLSRLPGCYFGGWVLDVHVEVPLMNLLIPCTFSWRGLSRRKKCERSETESLRHSRLVCNLSYSSDCVPWRLQPTGQPIVIVKARLDLRYKARHCCCCCCCY